MSGQMFEAVVPPEPAEKAVILDKQTRPWQRITNGWSTAGAGAGVDWLTLLTQYGPVRLIHDPKADLSGPTPEIQAAAESERETWRMARAQLAQALGIPGVVALDGLTWPELLAKVKELSARRDGVR